jgi:hypothetical protein
MVPTSNSTEEKVSAQHPTMTNNDLGLVQMGNLYVRMGNMARGCREHYPTGNLMSDLHPDLLEGIEAES